MLSTEPENIQRRQIHNQMHSRLYPEAVTWRLRDIYKWLKNGTFQWDGSIIWGDRIDVKIREIVKLPSCYVHSRTNISSPSPESGNSGCDIDKECRINVPCLFVWFVVILEKRKFVEHILDLCHDFI